MTTDLEIGGVVGEHIERWKVFACKCGSQCLALVILLVLLALAHYAW